MKKRRYSEYKPLDCEHCYYLLPEKPEVPPFTEGCVYGRDRTCVGWCMMVILGQAKSPPCRKRKK